MVYRSLVGQLFGFDTDLGSLVVAGQPWGPLVPRGYGKDWYVDSVTGHASVGGNSPVKSFATINQAIAKVRANKGDRIICLPGHAENISSATALLATKAGVEIIGLGSGSARPTLTLDTANTASIVVSAAGVTFTNMVFVANFLSIAAPFTLTTAKDFTLRKCQFRETSSVLNFLNIVKSTGAANTVDGLRIEDCEWFGKGTTSVNSFVLTANDIDRQALINNRVILARTATAAVLQTVTAGVLTNMTVLDNVAISQQTADTGGGFINVGGTTSSGIVARNYLGDLSTTDLFMTTTVGVTFVDNRKTGVITASGYPLPALDS